jgi:hypothetical protein
LESNGRPSDKIGDALRMDALRRRGAFEGLEGGEEADVPVLPEPDKVRGWRRRVRQVVESVRGAVAAYKVDWRLVARVVGIGLLVVLVLLAARVLLSRNDPRRGRGPSSISIISAARDAAATLQQTVPTWLAAERVSEVILVDWCSAKPLRETLRTHDPRLRIVEVSGCGTQGEWA